MAAEATVNNLAFLHRDRGYRWIDRDPVLEEVTTAISKSGLSLTWISDRSGVSVSTLANWMNGKTRRPQNITVKFVMGALGYQSQFVKRKRIEDEVEAHPEPIGFGEVFPKIQPFKRNEFMKPER